MSMQNFTVTGHKQTCPALVLATARCTCYDTPGVSHTVAELHAKLDAIAESQGKLLAALSTVEGMVGRYFSELKMLYGKLNYNLEQPPRKARKKVRHER